MKLEIESLVNARKRDKVVRKQEKEKGQEHLKVQETKHEVKIHLLNILGG